jgi:hypothetical protein
MKLILILAWSMLPLMAGAQTLVHRYTFERSSARGADSVGQQTGILTTEQTYTEAPVFTEKIRPAVRFASMQVGKSYGVKKSGLMIPTAVLAGGNEGTIAFFAQATGSPNAGKGAYLVAGGHLDEGAFILQYRPFILHAAAGDAEKITVPNFQADQWVHCALTWNNTSGEVVFFLNGQAVGKSQAKPGSFNPLVATRVGSFNLAAEQSEALEAQFQGYLYDLQVYDAQLNPTQVAKLARAPGQVLKELK